VRYNNEGQRAASSRTSDRFSSRNYSEVHLLTDSVSFPGAIAIMAEAHTSTASIQEMKKDLDEIKARLQDRGCSAFIQHCIIRELEEKVARLTKQKQRRERCPTCGRWGPKRDEART
jgi:hypothetical protein